MPGDGPLPTKRRRRRNAPSIPTTELPVAGRKGRAPTVPKGVELGAAGKRWWTWAWSTPQAAAWDRGSHMAVAQRALLEDHLTQLKPVDVGSIPTTDADVNDWLKELDGRLRRQQRATAQYNSILREMRERDDRLGLSPAAAAYLRMSFHAEPSDELNARRAAPRGRR